MAGNTTTGSRTNRQRIQQHLRTFTFKTLFVEELGWDSLNEHALPITVEGVTYALRPLVEKRGVQVFVCDPDAQGKIPPDGVLRKIEREVTRHAYEHIIIYMNAAREHQVWQWVKREQGKRLISHMHRYHKGQSGELLAQKLERLAIGLEEEERLHMAEVAGRVARAFDVERVTKKFYDRFKREHAAFLTLIGGIAAQTDREWYASLMLNRLMFIYFIQRKGFLDTKAPGRLDGDPNYLSNRLKRVQQEQGENQFHTFYRYFLLKLFHEGLSQRKHPSELESLLGAVPYLNGGLFDVHVLERANPEIAIPDEAFEQLFAFLDEFDWHLDDRPLRSDREINPDVLGYIFEKYINQKQMGAYYTKEDITEYISKSTILPFLLDAAEQKCQIAFRADGPVWSLLRENPDAYLYEAVKKGYDMPLPLTIEAGLHDVMQRGEWNKPAPEAYALPTETWREVVARRTRYQDMRAKLSAGEITSVNDLITYNLDSRRFVEDVITYCTGTDLLRALYDSIEHVTVLDPTCGSGAFLFSALGILEGLYEACLDRMQDLVEEREVLDAVMSPEKRHRSPDIAHFQSILERVKHHPSRAYFIYKSIIIRNLYGVDIMEEAAEICKLRLFLKLVSQVERFEDIEPLPDIDFNIRAGNTLVGFASHDETKQAIEGKTVGKGTTRVEVAFQGQMIFDDRLERVEQKAQNIEVAFDQFRELQVKEDLDPTVQAAHKQQLQQMLGILRVELDGYLASEYGIERNSIPKREEYDVKLAQWQQKHQPFHWWVEFYGIMKRGGFDVIIGNPPYVAYSKVRSTYQVHNYLTEPCGNLYAFAMERSLHLLRQGSYFGMIVPVSSVSSESYKPLISLFLSRQSWLSSYSNRPGKLFAGVEQRLTIFIVKNSVISDQFAAPYQHWYESERDRLFHSLFYTRASIWAYTGMPIKSGSLKAEAVFAHLTKQGGTLPTYDRADRFAAWFHDGPTYWVRALPFEPNIGMKSDRSNHYHRMAAKSHNDALILAALLNSSTFYLFFKMVSNCRDLGQKEWTTFPFGKPTQNTLEDLVNLGQFLEKRLQSTAVKCTRQYPSGTIEYEEYYPAKSKSIIDEIDRVLAKHYGFTDEELDFIINYDIKYRMGQSSAEEEEE